jgi:membrane fusion protein, multidrug efflux system
MSEETQIQTKNRNKRATIIINILLIICLITAIIWAISTYFDLGETLYTNDAQVEEFINPVNIKISGYIKEVRFNDHQNVKKGDTLVIIDNREYKIQLEQAEASYLAALASRVVSESSVSTIQNNLNVSDASIKASKARLWNAEQNLRRYENLIKEGAATQQQYDQFKTEFDAQLAQTKALMEQKNTTQFSTNEASNRLFVNDADIKRTHATMEMAKLNLSYTVIIAPYNATTGRRTLQEGQLVQQGQSLMSLVRSNSKWVVANYKETKLSKLFIGKKMNIEVDGFQGKKIKGEITAISQATGSKFSAIPVDNSTGNFIKVQQRIPVKIEFTPDNDKRLIQSLRAGMNVEVTSEN